MKALTEAAVRQYQNLGYYSPVPVMDPAEAHALRDRLEAFEANAGRLAGKLRHKPHLLFTWLSDLIHHPRILDAVEDVIGPDILCWGTSFFIKEPRTRSFVSWHQDSTYYGIDPPDTCTAWLAISEASIASGCMRFIPGSHNKGLYSHEELKTQQNLLSRGQTVVGIDESKAKHVPLKAGQFSFHKEDCLHSSHPNTTNDRRIGLSIHFVAPHVRETNFPGASAMLLRGQDKYGYWKADLRPKVDFDPECMAELDRVLKMYRTAPEKRKKTA